MNFELSVLMPLLTIVVSVAAAFFWNGQGSKGIRAEEYLYAMVRDNTIGSLRKLESPKVLVRVEVLPGDHLRPSDLRARDKTEDVAAV